MDPIEMIQEHPGFRAVREAHDKEMEEKQEEIERLERDIDDKDERINNAESSVTHQFNVIDEIFPRDKDGERAQVRFQEFKEKLNHLADRKLYRYERDWDVLSYLGECLENVIPEVEVRRETNNVYVDVFPAEAKEKIKSAVKLLTEI